jgi:hypothetical protein
MRTSALISIRHVIEQAIDAINDSFEREKQSQKISTEFGKEYERLLELTQGDAPTTELEQSSTTQHQRVPLSSPRIEGFYPWRHRVVLAANALAECGWTIEAGAIHDELNKLPTHQVDWAQPGARDDLRDEIQAVGTRIRDVLACCVTEILANKSDAGSILQSSKPENATRTVDNFDVARARERLRPYVEKSAFREYLKERILEWEAWHRSQVDEIRMHEIARDYDKERLDRAISQGILDPEDKDDVYVLSYEWHKYEVTSLPENFEFKLVAEGEPVLFHAASVAAMVALFWCDINHSSKLVPDYSTLPDFDPLDPYGPFNNYLFEQWRNPVPGRYERIDWFVDAAIKEYVRASESGGVKQFEEHEQVEQSDRSKGLHEAALKAVIDGGLAGVLSAASNVDAVTKHSETMMMMLKTDIKYYEWSADDWVTRLKAAKGTIIKTSAWKYILGWRLENKAKRKAN